MICAVQFVLLAFHFITLVHQRECLQLLLTVIYCFFFVLRSINLDGGSKEKISVVHTLHMQHGVYVNEEKLWKNECVTHVIIRIIYRKMLLWVMKSRCIVMKVFGDKHLVVLFWSVIRTSVYCSRNIQLLHFMLKLCNFVLHNPYTFVFKTDASLERIHTKIQQYIEQEWN